MSKKSIRSIILLMSISLLGLIAFQAYWISTSISREASKFDKDMHRLTARAADDILKKEAYVFVESISSTEEIKDLSGITEIDSKVKVIINQVSSEDIINTEEDHTIVYNSEDGNTTVISSSSPSKNGVKIKERITSGLKNKFVKKKTLLTEVVDEMAFKFAFSETSLSDRLEGISIDTIISNSFKKAGYDDLTYSFIVKDLDIDSIIKSGGSLNWTDKINKYEASINEDGSGSLLLTIPNKTSLILKSLWLMLLLSLILTFILVSTFIYTINSILKQKRISQMKADFINNMTHEFKTPVATISLAIDSIMHKEVQHKPEEINKLGNIIKKENGRMNKQIESLLEIAMFDKESFQMELEEINAHQVLSELKENFEIKISKQAGDIALFLEAKNFTISADKMHFYNAIRNIIDNGIKFSNSSFRLKIKTHSNSEHLVVQISDQGIGMSKDTQTKIFDRFYRKTEGNIHTTKGFGLGLPYVKEVIDKMDGIIEVESELGKGSIFNIKIPLK